MKRLKLLLWRALHQHNTRQFTFAFTHALHLFSILNCARAASTQMQTERIKARCFQHHQHTHSLSSYLYIELLLFSLTIIVNMMAKCNDSCAFCCQENKLCGSRIECAVHFHSNSSDLSLSLSAVNVFIAFVHTQPHTKKRFEYMLLKWQQRQSSFFCLNIELCVYRRLR